jgi:hypothetical protein
MATYEEILKHMPEKTPFVNPDPGKGTYGLTDVKIITLKKSWQGKVRQGPGYRLVFRSLSKPEAYANIEVFAAQKKNSHLYKITNAMTDGSLPEKPTREEITKALFDCIGKWFSLVITLKAGTKNPNFLFTNVNMDLIRKDTETQKQYGSCFDFFGVTPKDTTSETVVVEKEDSNGFEDDDLPDGAYTEEELAKKAKKDKKLDDILDEVL